MKKLHLIIMLCISLACTALSSADSQNGSFEIKENAKRLKNDLKNKYPYGFKIEKAKVKNMTVYRVISNENCETLKRTKKECFNI